MARVTLSAIVQDLKGSVSGGTFSGWKGVLYLRNKAQAVSNPQTPQQQKIRAVLAASVGFWPMLPEDVRHGWEEYAQQRGRARSSEKQEGTRMVVRPVGRIMSGFNAYVGVNQMVESAGYPRVTVPPIPFQRYPAPAMTVAWDPVAGTLAITASSVEPFFLFFPARVRFWLKGTWAGAMGYIAAVSDDIPAPVPPAPVTYTKTVWVSVLRVGGTHNLGTVPLVNLRYETILVQCDVVDSGGNFSFPSTVADIFLSPPGP